MMKISKFLKASLVTAVAATAVLFPVATAAAIPAGSVPYAGEETSGTTFPAFNIFNGVPSVGNEGDFIRVKKDGEGNSTLRNSVDTECKTGDRFDVWFYLHNGAKPSLNNNGTGPGVAHNVVAKVTLPSTTGQNITGGVTASNAEAISDTAIINCAGKQFRLKFVSNSASAFLDLSNQVVALPNSIVEGGASIGTTALNGDVWGCWDQRVWMGMKVEVEEIPEVVKTPPVCEALTITQDRRKVTVNNVAYRANDSTVSGVRIDFGDGTVQTVTSFPISHDYSRDGDFTIRATVMSNNGNVTSDDCVKKITVSPTPTPPVTPPVTPPTLPSTGAGDVIAIFAATTVAGALIHRFVLSRRFGRL
jgi:hypothetical protein